VLILTNDGDLAAALTHPRHEVTKTYHVKFQGRLDDEALTALSQGITLDDGVVTRPAEEVSVIKETETNTWVQITLRQGLNRQVRRMGDAIGHPVLKLIRVAVSGLTADGLADGEFRPLTPTEVYDLMSAANPEPVKKARAKPTPCPATSPPNRRSPPSPRDLPPSRGQPGPPRGPPGTGRRPVRRPVRGREAGKGPAKSAKSRGASPSRGPLAQRRRPG
jgi:23S rRNA pseudouridine2605 synthase